MGAYFHLETRCDYQAIERPVSRRHYFGICYRAIGHHLKLNFDASLTNPPANHFTRYLRRYLHQQVEYFRYLWFGQFHDCRGRRQRCSGVACLHRRRCRSGYREAGAVVAGAATIGSGEEDGCRSNCLGQSRRWLLHVPFVLVVEQRLVFCPAPTAGGGGLGAPFARGLSSCIMIHL
jgi:hypothetical protein